MTLLAPLFLLGVLAVGLPMWLHRLSSENPNKQKFSSVMFLEPGEPRRVLAKRLQYLLLLAFRIGVLVLLAFAFARPALLGAPEAIVEDSARLNLIIMDTSASMRHGQRWPRARDIAEGIIDDVPSGDLMQLLAVGRTARVLVDPTLEASGLRQSLNALNPDYSHLDYGELMNAVDLTARGVELPVVVHLVTDLQQSSMPTRFAELAAQVPLELNIYDAARPGESNWGVQSVSWTPATQQIAVSVRGYGTPPAEKDLVLELNGERVAQQPLSIAADGTVTAEFGGLDLGEGANRVRMYLDPGDALAVDDQRFVVVKRPEPRTVLLLTQDPTGRDALFLTAAMETMTAQATTVERSTPAASSDLDLRAYAFIAVADAGILSDADAERLRESVAAGGGLLMALGQRSAGSSAVPVTGHAFLGTAQLGATGGAFTTVGTMDSSHPALAGIDELRAAKFYRYTEIQPVPADQVLVQLERGQPLLIDHRLDQGRVILFTSSLDRQWNDLPVLPVFVPLVSGLASYLAGELSVQTEARLGATLSPRAVGLASGQIFDPQGNAALGIAAAGLGDEVLLESIGFYEILGSGRTELVAVNMDPIESDLRLIEPNALERWRNLNVPLAEVAAAENVTVEGAEPTPLWPWVLGLLIAVVFVESWIGNWHLRVRRGIAA